MRKEQVISKGKYAHTQPTQLIGVKQYLFIRDDDGKKKLLLRFVNNRNEACSKFAFLVYRLDVKGNILGEDRFESTEREYTGKEVFAFDRMIDVEEKCSDFVVKVLYADYGEYTYHVENNEVSVSYDEAKTGTKRRRATKERARKIHSRSFEMPWAFAVVALIILALAFAITSYFLRDFKENNSDFSLSGVHYKFADENRETVIITGCSNNYRDITLPSTIDGLEVIGIEKDAFKNNTALRKIKIDGIVIDSETFKDCDKLETVEIVNVSVIGDGAFYSCDNLKTVKISDGEEEKVLTLGDVAFGECESLKTVEINQTVKLQGDGAVFKKSYGIESLTLKSFAYTIEGVSSPDTYQTQLCALFGDTVSEKSSSSLKELTVSYMDQIPAFFVKGFTELQKVTVKESDIKLVGDGAFQGCKSLEKLEIKSLLESVGSYAFAGVSIESIDLTNLKTLGNNAFQGANDLNKVVGYGSGGIDNVPQSAFEGCSALKEFAFTEGVKRINTNAFKNSGLEKMSIPQTVEYVGNGVLSECDSLKELDIYTLGEGGYLAYYFGVDKKDNENNYFADFIPKSLKTVTLGQGEEITAYAFAGCSGVEKINLPEGVTVFGDYAFNGCTSLKTLAIPSTTLVRIGEYALAGTAIEVVELPTTLEYIGFGALEGCKNVKSLTIPFLGQTPSDGNGTIAYIFGATLNNSWDKIPDSLKSITLVPMAPITTLPVNAFRDCNNATSISFPSTVSVIGEACFANCSSLTTLNLTGVEHIGGSAFTGCSSLVSVELSNKLLSVGEYAFENTGLTNLDLPSSVQTIGFGILSGCDKIITLKTPFLGSDYQSVGNANMAYLFGANVSKSDIIPSSLTSITISLPFFENAIRNDAFYNCVNVSSFNLPDGVETVGESAFGNCAKLNWFDFDSVTSIGVLAFENTGLVSVTLNDGLVYLRDGVFMNCVSLEEVILPSGLFSIGASAFENTGITKISLPNGIISIGEGAFSASKLESVTVPASVTAIGIGAFNGCNKMSSISFPFTRDFDNVNYLFNIEEGLPQSLKSITVNASCNTTLAQGAFEYCSFVEEIIIDANISYIDASAFHGCYELRYVSIPSAVLTVAESAFGLCYHLYEISYSGEAPINASGLITVTPSFEERAPVVEKNGYKYAKYGDAWYLINYPKGEKIETDDTLSYKGEAIEEYHIPSCLFFGDTRITEAHLSSMTASLGRLAFDGCTSLEILEFKDNTRVKEILDDAFASCNLLKTVSLPNSVTVIGARAFNGCSLLESVKMPVALEKIGEFAFYGCSKLNLIKLHFNVNSIGENAFYGCSALYDLYSDCSLPLVAGSASYGYVARYAVKVQTDMDAEPSQVITVNGIGEFRRSGGSWLLIKGAEVNEVILDTFKYEDVKVSSFRIKENAFENNSKIKSLIVGDAVKQIQLNAFANCHNLTSVDMSENSSLKELESGVFYNCFRLRFVYLPNTLAEIGSGAFGYCELLETVDMPNNLEKIGSEAFYGCSRLVSVTLPVGLKSIGDGAFTFCDSLYEVYDLSLYLDITNSMYENGGVGANACEIFTTSSQGLERYEKDGLKLIKAQDKWYLYSYLDDGKKLLCLPSLDADIVIMNRAFIDTSFDELYISKSVKTVEGGIFYGNSSLENIYYEGTMNDWQNVSDSSELMYSFNLYYYGKCVHYDSFMLWTYDKNNKITTDRCGETSEVTLPSTCYTEGIRTHYCACDGCDYSRETVESTLRHVFKDDVCELCQSVRTTIDSETLSPFVQNGTIETMYFEYNKELGCFTSTNHHNYMVGRFLITAKEKMTVSMNYRVSSQENSDYLIIYYNGNEYGSMSGEAKNSLYLTLYEGDTLVINYVKDGDGGAGQDTAYIEKLEIITEPKNQESDGNGSSEQLPNDSENEQEKEEISGEEEQEKEENLNSGEEEQDQLP